MQTLRVTLPRLRHEPTEIERTTAFNNFTKELLAFAAGYGSAKEAILADKDLSPTGQAKKLALLQQSFVPAFNEFPQRLGRIREQFQREADTHYRPPVYKPDPNPVLEFLRGQEIRNYLNSLPQDERLRQLLDPSRDPDGLFLHHAATSPIPLPGVTREILERGQQAREAALNPDGQIAVEDQRIVLDVLAYNVGEVGKLLGIVTAEATEE